MPAGVWRAIDILTAFCLNIDALLSGQEIDMKRIALAGTMLMVAFAASADPAYTITNMSCAAVQAAVKANGSVILHYRSKRNPGLPLYGRYVSDRRFCASGQIVNFASVPAADKSCNVRQCNWKVRGRF